jgi:hypothetical protein
MSLTECSQGLTVGKGLDTGKNALAMELDGSVGIFADTKAGGAVREFKEGGHGRSLCKVWRQRKHVEKSA